MPTRYESIGCLLRSAVIVLIVLGFAVVVGNMLMPASTAAPTLAGEPATVYVGLLTQVSGAVGLLVSHSQARALACSLDPGKWQAIDAWLSVGTSQNGTLKAENPATGAKLSAQISGDEVRGNYTTATSERYPFTLSRVREGAPPGVYTHTFDGQQDPGLTRSDLRLVVLDVQKPQVCGMIMRNNLPTSRVVTATWQEGLSTFVMLDLPDSAGNPTVVSAPGVLGHILAIAVP
ncbi:MAG TPA: hypothetical protein VMT34_08555 [Aggregatilineales bacterium]|nr:hypothetical protein [Aggregatilineales bacterium]